jgi:hypothetical protein
MSSGTAQVSHQICQFFVIYVYLLVRITVVDTKQGFRLLFASQIGRNVIRKEEKKS